MTAEGAGGGPGAGPSPDRVTVWDAPVRLVHWAIAALVAFSWWSAKSDHLAWHRLSGYTILGLLVFRLIWGVIGSETARFSSFLAGPRTVLAYLGGRAAPRVGHNPLGGWSVVVLFTLLAIQVGLGLFSVDEDAIEAGPLDRFVSFNTGRAITHWHHLVFNLLLVFIGLHLVAIAVYAARRRDLVSPMLSGRAILPPGATAPRRAGLAPFVVAATLALAAAWWIAHGLKLS
ncbi:MAG: cytochrome b/b6 domain-containing protein [Alphaproteobacteria bacterium]|jgi:cytochrome b|nr:cytochrome b/b6 domain-containing protein [Alphaproteobacteria bacterium]